MGRLDRSPRANWVENRGGLPDYIDRIAVHLNEKGMPISQAIAVAINAVKKACATGDLNFPGMQNENAGSRAEACAAVAQWEAMKTHKSSHPRGEGLELASPCTGCSQGEPLALAGGWNAMLHPRNPAGSAGGGKFTSSGSGGAKKSTGKGGGKGAGKGGAKGKGAKQSASAQAAAQAKVIAPQFLKMNPQQRAQFLAKLTNPQLAGLYKVVNAGNSNDPSTKAALIAIKDQMAARSLTGAKGPTAVNQAKAASAAKSAASKQASTAKKTASAAKSAASKQASAAKKQTAAQTAAARKQLAAAKAAATAQAKAQKTAVANQAAALKAQAAMKATTQKAQVAGLTSALKATSNPAQQAQILAQLKKALGLAQTASVTDTLALATDGHQYRHGWVRIDGDTPKGKTSGSPTPARPKNAETCKNCDHGSGLLTSVDYDEHEKPITETDLCGICDGHGWVVPDAKTVAAQAKNDSLNERLRRDGMPGFTWTGKKWVKVVATSHVAMAMPSAASGDGPDITVNAGLKSPRDVRMAVAGHGKVPPHRQAAYRKKVTAAAKKLGPAGMRHVPPAWMKD